eukprot:11827489-Alexandrium_andersonii.AAC.1
MINGSSFGPSRKCLPTISALQTKMLLTSNSGAQCNGAPRCSTRALSPKVRPPAGSLLLDGPGGTSVEWV